MKVTQYRQLRHGFGWALGVLLLAPLAAAAGIPHTVGFQGFLSTSGGSPVTGTKGITFRVYDAAGGAALCTETHNAVAVANGVFSVRINSTGACDNLAFDRPYMVGIQIVGEAAEMSPRLPLDSTGYAHAAHAVSTSVNVDCGTGGSVQGAIADAPIGPLTVVLTGRCHEDLIIKRSRVTIRGASQTDGIDGAGGAAVTVIGATRVLLDGLTIGGNADTGVMVENNGFVEIDNAVVQGFTSYGIHATHGGMVKAFNLTVHGPDSTVAPVTAPVVVLGFAGGGQAYLENVTADGNFDYGANYSTILGAYRSGPIRITGTSALLNHHPNGFAVDVWYNVIFRQTGNATYIGSVACGLNSNCQFRGSEIFGKKISAWGGKLKPFRRRTDRAASSTAIGPHPAAPPGVGLFVQAGAGGELDFQSGTGNYAIVADSVQVKEHSRFAIASGVTLNAGNASVFWESAMSLRGNATLGDVGVSDNSRVLFDAGVTVTAGNIQASGNAGVQLGSGTSLTVAGLDHQGPGFLDLWPGASLHATGNLSLSSLVKANLNDGATVTVGGQMSMLNFALLYAGDNVQITTTGGFNFTGASRVSLNGTGITYNGDMFFSPEDYLRFGPNAVVNGNINCNGGTLNHADASLGGAHTLPNCTELVN